MSTLAELYKKAPLGETKFFQYAKKRLPGVTTKQVKEFLTAQKAHQETRVQGRGERVYARYEAKVGDHHQIDLYQTTGQFEEQGFKYLCVVIDIGSRYALAVPMKNKTAETTLAALKKIYTVGVPPNKPLKHPTVMEADDGSEFHGAFARWCAENSIELVYGQPDEKRHGSIVERFIGTLSRMVNRQLEADGKWVDSLPDLLETYNGSKHSTIRQAPEDIHAGTAQPNRKAAVKKNQKVLFHVMDKVRVLLPTTQRRRIHSQNWSKEEYLIGAVRRQKSTGAILYSVFDGTDGETLRKSFYAWELQRV